MRAPDLTMKRARRLRREMSPPEVMLWQRLRRRSDQAPAFRRQHPMGPYILDFYCHAAKLAIEVDGYVHATGDHPQRDERKDRYLRSQGLEVLRLAASEVMADPDEAADGVIRLAIGLATGQGR
jgi:very-short-patch-repair endonuclease